MTVCTFHEEKKEDCVLPFREKSKDEYIIMLTGHNELMLNCHTGKQKAALVHMWLFLVLNHYHKYHIL